LNITLLGLGLLLKSFIFFFHLSEFFIGILFFGHCLSSLPFHFSLELFDLFLGQFAFSLESHVILIVLSGLSDFVFKFGLQVSDSFFI
jgi:hypothetical protein